MGKQPAVLNHIAQGSAHFQKIVSAELSAVDMHRAGCGLQNAADQPQQGRFSASAWPDERGSLSGLHNQIGWMQGKNVAKLAAQALQLNQRAHLTPKNPWR